jgi:hypothetical protein
MSGDIIIASKREAEDRAERIRTALSVSWDLIKDAWKAFDWQALGYASWDAYCDGEFGTSRIRLPREERREVVSSMREIGMSTRAIASATGMSPRTAAREVAAGVPNGTADTEPVTGTDGKTYTQPERPRATAMSQGDLDALNTPPATSPAEPADTPMPEWENVAQLPPQAVQQMQQQKPKRRPLTDEALRAVLDLNRAVDRLRRITEDDRFSENRRRIREQSLSDLQRADNTIHDTITDLEKD